MRRLAPLAPLALLATLALQPPADAPDGRSVARIADGVWVIRHRTTPFEGGNTTVVVGDREVLVVDACQLPNAPSWKRSPRGGGRRWPTTPRCRTRRRRSRSSAGSSSTSAGAWCACATTAAATRTATR